MNVTPRPARALLAGGLAAIPLALAGVAAVIVPASTFDSAPLATSSSASTQALAYCPAPLGAAVDAGAQSSDSAFERTGPSDSLRLRALAFEPESSLLYGYESLSETRFDSDGNPLRPRLDVAGLGDAAVEVEGQGGESDFTLASASEAGAATSVSASSSQGSEPPMHAAVSALTRDGDFRSLALGACTPTSTRATFVDTPTSVGTSSVLHLHNPSSRGASARITVFSPDGVAPSSAANTVTLAGGQSADVMLSSLAPEADIVAISVDVEGSALAMSLDSAALDGLTPRGADFIPKTRRAPVSVFPQVRIEESGSARLTVFNPSGEGVSPKVEAIDSQGRVRELEPATIPSTSVGTLPLDSLEAGTYALRVSAPTPIAAAVRTRVSGEDLEGDTVGAPSDFAIHAASPALVSGTLVPLPQGGEGASLGLMGTQDSSVSVQAIRADGSLAGRERVDLSAERATSVSVADIEGDAEASEIAAVVVVPSGSGETYGALTMNVELADSARGVAAMPLEGTSPAAVNPPIEIQR